MKYLKNFGDINKYPYAVISSENKPYQHIWLLGGLLTKDQNTKGCYTRFPRHA